MMLIDRILVFFWLSILLTLLIDINNIFGFWDFTTFIVAKTILKSPFSFTKLVCFLSFLPLKLTQDIYSL